MYLGAHVSIAESIAHAPGRGAAVGCESIQIFSRSPRMLRNVKSLTREEIDAFRRNLETHGIRKAIIHGNYLINLASPKKSMLKLSRTAFVDELERAQQLGIREVVFHPGAHLGKGEAFGIKTVAQSLDRCFETASAPDTVACLEITAGQGSVVGYTIEQLADIVAASANPDRLGICVDTCHAFAAGYDLRAREGYDAFWRRVDEAIGLRKVYAFHLNDSKGDLNSRVDRHEDIGKGKLGLEPFRLLVNDARFRELPGCLEYPGSDSGYRQNLRVLRSLIGLEERQVPKARAGRRGDRGARRGAHRHG